MAEWIFLRARPDWERSRFTQWLSAEAAPRLARSVSGLRRCRLHVAPDPGPELPGFLSDEPDSTSNESADGSHKNVSDRGAPVNYAGAFLLDGANDIHVQALAKLLREGTSAWHMYRATATVVKDVCDAEAAPWADGITYLRPITFHADMAPSAARRSWALHAPLAVRTHRGACRYVQWWIEAVLSPQTPPIAGIVELRFPTDHDLAGQFFPSEREREDIARDTGHFIASGTRMYTREQELLT